MVAGDATTREVPVQDAGEGPIRAVPVRGADDGIHTVAVPVRGAGSHIRGAPVHVRGEAGIPKAHHQREGLVPSRTIGLGSDFGVIVLMLCLL